MAFALGVYTCREVWFGYVERKIKSVHANTGILDLLLDWSPSPVFHRDTAPVRYWMTMVLQTFGMVACFICVIIGWWQPNT